MESGAPKVGSTSDVITRPLSCLLSLSTVGGLLRNPSVTHTLIIFTEKNQVALITCVPVKHDGTCRYMNDKWWGDAVSP